MRKQRGDAANERKNGWCGTNSAGGDAVHGCRPTDGLEQVKIGNGELLRATCWASRERRLLEVTEKVTETVTQTLKGKETTCTRETRRQVTEYTETREIGERPHGGDGVGAAHTHTHRGSGGQWG